MVLGGEVDVHERHEGDHLVDIDQNPERLKTRLTEVRKWTYRKHWEIESPIIRPRPAPSIAFPIELIAALKPEER